ncbi:MAG: BatD family protein, partial [Halioglobus sp.]|nr:BatD family protein [Halioglobus sp.]
MMKPIGNTLAILIVLIIMLGTPSAVGSVTASLDRNKVALGDTLRLTIIATEGEEMSEADLRALNKDFEVMGRSTNNSTSIINGRMSRTRQLSIDLMPKREGEIQVPSIRMGKNITSPLLINVIPASDTLADGKTVIFELEVDKDSVYVQGQLILTLRVQQSINLDGRSISELKLANAFVKPLEQHSFQRNIDGRPWRVDELRYAIFPEQSGTLEIPAQVFSGRTSRGQRSFFDMGNSGQLVRRSTAPLFINVLPKPSSFTADTWLPAQRLTLQETWSTDPNELRVGESTTRTIEVVGEGLQGAQLPPILFTPIEGLKYYPDQPQISEQEVADGLVGIRQDSAAVVAIRPGTYLIPEIRIPWWSTQTETLEYAILPER